MNKKLLVFIVVLLLEWCSGFSAYCQTGSIKGIVRDTLLDETLIGVILKIEGVNQGVVTDGDGAFSFSRVEPGTYTITASYMSYNTLTVRDVKVSPGSVTELDLVLTSASQQLENIVITAARSSNTQKAVIYEVKNAVQLMSGISAEQIRLSQDRDAAQVMSRVPGITIVENRFIMVRGVPERYNQVMLNNVIAPSTEVDRRTFSFDLIPSNVLDRMMIYKSGSAENVGDFAGGLTKIYTKNLLDDDFAEVSVSTGYRTGTTFSDFQNAPGGGFTDVLGFDNQRGLPSSFPATDALKNSPRRSQLRENAGRTLKNTFVPEARTAIPNIGISFSGGKGWNLGTKRLSTITAVNYAQSYQYFARDFHRYFTWERNDIENGRPIQEWFDYVDHSYEKENRIGLISNWQLKLDAFNKIEFRNLFNQIGENVTVIREGQEYQQFANQPRRNYMMGYRGRSIYNGQMEGTHHFSRSNSSVDWVLGMNYLSEDEPDLRRFRTVQPVGGEGFQMILPPSSNLFDAGRYYGKLKESGYSHALNYDKMFGGTEDRPFHIKAGYLVDYRMRKFSARYLSYLYPGTNDPTIGEEIKSMPLDQVFAPENIRMENGLAIEEGTRNIDQYDASNLLTAGYVSAILPLGKFTVNAGMRMEYNIQRLNSFNDAAAELKVNNPILSPLAFLNVDYRFNDKQLIRFAYGRTVNRPEFRELAPFMYYDFKMDASKVGNPNLKTAYIHNFDLRYEVYPRDGEALSLGVFYKNFVNPIETQIFVMTEQPGLGFTNAHSAYNYGAEIEIRKSLRNLTSSRFLDRFSINLNASLIASQVSYADSGNLAQDATRALQGQSPYIINAGLYYNDERARLQASISYNIFGPRIYAVGSYIFPTIYELPRHAIDLTISKSLGKRTSMKFGIQDLLNARYRFYQDSDLTGKIDVAVDHPIFTFRRGALYNLTFTYKL